MCMSECVYVCVCVRAPLRLLITSSVIWTPYEIQQFLMAAVVGITSKCGLGI